MKFSTCDRILFRVGYEIQFRYPMETNIHCVKCYTELKWLGAKFICKREITTHTSLFWLCYDACWHYGFYKKRKELLHLTGIDIDYYLYYKKDVD